MIQKCIKIQFAETVTMKYDITSTACKQINYIRLLLPTSLAVESLP